MGVAAVAKVRQKPNVKAQKSGNKLTEAQIAVHWKEEEYFRPSKKFIAQANLTDPAFVKKFSEKHFPECFDHYASFLDWDKPWRKTLDTSNPPFWKWFVGGKLNACYNCVDRHLAKHRNKAALIFVPEIGRASCRARVSKAGGSGVDEENAAKAHERAAERK